MSLMPQTISRSTDQSSAGGATIASISSQDFFVTRTYGVFHIPACPAGKDFDTLAVTAREDAIDLGDNHRITLQISARDIAADIIQDLEDHGIFVCGGGSPSIEELAAARTRRDGWHSRLVAEADEMWARGHSYREISDMHRRAAFSLGLEREWAYTPQASRECPACGEKVRAGVAVCRHCKAVLDEERAAKYFPNAARDKSQRPQHPNASHVSKS
ncbi:MAG TPA: zinc ribbon domain-containing protein [Verrucomicrobiae bacterium]|nr:zinc ribbon domain-containing protein [Verrucomicrobiae bacterium]